MGLRALGRSEKQIDGFGSHWGRSLMELGCVIPRCTLSERERRLAESEIHARVRGLQSDPLVFPGGNEGGEPGSLGGSRGAWHLRELGGDQSSLGSGRPSREARSLFVFIIGGDAASRAGGIPARTCVQQICERVGRS